MISQTKRLLKAVVPAPVFRGIYRVYRHSFYYAVNFTRRAYVNSFFRAPKVIMIRNSKLKIMIDPSNGYTDKNLFLFKERDTDLIETMKKFINPGETMVDIGANIGYETVWGAHIVGASGRVYSFEPITKLANQVQLSLEGNNFHNVKLIRKAVGEKTGTAVIYTHPEDAGLTSIENKDGASESTVIPVTTIDEELGAVQKISFIKMDIEGYEFEALKGAKEILTRDHPTIVFEFTPVLYEKSYKGKSKDILLYLMDMGYVVSVMGAHTLLKKETLANFVDTMLKENRMVNMLAEYKD